MVENDFLSIPDEQRRGIETIDINLELTLAFADIDSTINGLKKIGFTHHESNIANKNILVRESSRLIFTLKSQVWTYIYKPDKRWGATPPNREYVELSPEAVQQIMQNRLINNKSSSDEARLSQQLDSSVIYFGVSDTGDWITYSLFRSGNCLEWLISEENQVQGQSSIQAISFNKLDVYTLIYDSILNNNAYIPYIRGVKIFTIGENELVETYEVLRLSDDEVLRLDHVYE
jgi:hypothetical protein